MKIAIRELIRCAALIYLLSAPWAIVSSRVEGLGVVLLLAGILPAGSYLLGALKRDLEIHFPPDRPEDHDPPAAQPPATSRLRLVPTEKDRLVVAALADSHQAGPGAIRVSR